MNKDVPAGAAILLDFIAQHESAGRYDVIFGNHQGELGQPITTMTIDQLLTAQIGWGHKWKSSAAGRYQIVQGTLAELRRRLDLKGTEKFTPDLQDELGYELLKQRGYADFKAARLPLATFGRHLAQEWASLPVLADCRGARREIVRGQSYYAGDGLNNALVKAADFEAVLQRALAA